ncbi:hypothetical protein PYCCODRAFT_1046104 [Trametes coccinea BRFM310]|uniref:Ubiquitin-like domain-containing protein n=1 Tax=Trametes coccinea (strain BRFM310) TaxID=1353009 RepID=A0A1Y2I9U5_TRAC3|nr:hypothetical protein PYCCODRAFT_1046104 [Trametes coccinea BRFM310]
MELTFITELGQSFVVEIDPNMELENVMALLEAESGIPVAEQSLSYEGRDLSNPKATMRECGVGDHAMLLLRRKVSVAGRSVEQDAEMMRLQLLGDPVLMEQLRAVSTFLRPILAFALILYQTNPEIANAAQNDPARFAELLRQTHGRQAEAERDRALLEADPYDIEAQRRIEEAIRQQAVLENLEHALEYSPESFGRVTMLYEWAPGQGVCGQRSTIDYHEPGMRRSLRHHASRRPTIRRHRTGCRHSAHPRPRTLRPAQARRPLPPLLLHDHGGPRRRSALRARHAQSAPGLHRPREERAPHPGA